MSDFISLYNALSSCFLVIFILSKFDTLFVHAFAILMCALALFLHKLSAVRCCSLIAPSSSLVAEMSPGSGTSATTTATTTTATSASAAASPSNPSSAGSSRYSYSSSRYLHIAIFNTLVCRKYIFKHLHMS